MNRPDTPNFDVSEAAIEAVNGRIISAGGRNGLAFYSGYILLRMREQHPLLHQIIEQEIIGNTNKQRLMQQFGSALSYDMITEQLRLDDRTIVIDEKDTNLFYLDLITEGGSNQVTRQEVVDMRRTGLAIGMVTFETDFSWFINILKQTSPRFFAGIDYWVPQDEDSDTELDVDFSQGVLPPALVFYRKLGLLPQLPDRE